MPEKQSNRAVDSLIGSAWLLVFLQACVGIYLAQGYRSTVEQAHSSTVGLGPLAAFHYYASAACIILFGVSLLSLLWNGGHRWSKRWLWWTTLTGLLLCIGLQVTGNLLPMSAHDVRTANVEANIAGSAPVFGAKLRELTLQGEAFSQSTLTAWYALHRWVLPIGTLIALLAFMGVLSKRGARPSWLGAAIPIAVVALLAMSLGRPPDTAASANDFLEGGTKPMWYVAPMHVLLLSALKISPNMGWVGALLIPSLLLLVFALLPLFTRKGDGPSGSVRAFTSVGVLAFAGLAFWTQPKIQNPLDERVSPEQRTVTNDLAIDAKLVAEGRKHFIANKCLDCHKVGREGMAIVGPNLGKVGARYKDPQWYIGLLKNPASKDRDTMPAFSSLPQSELRALAEYLRSLR